MTEAAAQRFKLRLYARLKQIVDVKVVPVFKGVFYQMALDMLDLQGGTPQFSGNASANWYPSVNTASREFDPNAVPEVYGTRETPYSLHANPNWEAIDISHQRIRAFLDSLPINATRLVLVNNAPYLREYEPFGGDKLFRAENLWPVTADRVVERTRRQFFAAPTKATWRYA